MVLAGLTVPYTLYKYLYSTPVNMAKAKTIVKFIMTITEQHILKSTIKLQPFTSY